MRTAGATCLLLAALASVLCASVCLAQECPAGAGGTAPSEAEWRGLAEQAYEARGKAPSADHPLSSVVEGMLFTDVRLLLGNPDDVRMYPTGKSFAPMYFGNDAFRTEWRYRGAGRVVFSHAEPQLGGRVSRIDFNPEETGQLWIGARCGAPAPGSDAFSRVRPGMLDIEVRGLLGHPDRARSWPNAKAFNPLYFGFDRMRAEWVYEGLGTVTFFWGASNNVMHVLEAERASSDTP